MRNDTLTLPMYVADEIVVGSLQNQRAFLQGFLDDHVNKGKWLHPEDEKRYNELIPCFDKIIEFYGGYID